MSIKRKVLPVIPAQAGIQSLDRPVKSRLVWDTVCRTMTEENGISTKVLKNMYNDKRLHQLWLNCQYRQRYQPLSEIIAPLRTKFTDTRNKHLTMINAIWADLVGPDLADLAFPYKINADILIVSVASAAVKFTVEQIYRQAILEQIRERTGKRIKDIKCTLNTGKVN